MAWLETKGEVFRIRFRFGKAKHFLPLHSSDRREADEALARFKGNLRLIERGIIDAPPADADIGIYIVSGGKLKGRPSQSSPAERNTLAKLFDSYLTSFPRGAKEVRTWQTETTHIGHLRRLLDTNQLLSEISSKTLQAYIDARTLEKGKAKKTVRRETVHKEIGTFSSVWNKWGIQQGFTDRPAPVKNLTYPKGTTKPPFQIREQIERKIKLGKLSAEVKAELWRSLFLTTPEVEALLDYIRDLKADSFVYPMFTFAAHTGARRSEIRRSQVTDFDFASRTVMIREKKKDSAKVETYRTVPLTPRLEQVMRDWFASNPGNPHSVCMPNGQPLKDTYTTTLLHKATAGSQWAVIPGWHCLRHSFISNCAARGIDQRLIDHWVGHSTDAMRQRYSHLLPNVSQAAILSVFG
ncbi:MAG TPA: site-specific integrase [Gemmata sp.]|jgi:integrase|nr:site-specific integrase [Gemmata sp.]